MVPSSPTVSVGVAVLSPAAFSLQQMIGHADLALYQAKASGRNCVRAIELEQGEEHGASVVVEAPPLKPVLVSSRQPARGKAS
jgi:predicted signal transduction protein with EAL and GGDEF domain